MDKLLTQVKQGIEAKIPPNLQEDTQKMVVAGMKIMFDAQTHQMMMKQINQSGDITDNVAKGIGALMSIIFRSSKGAPPIDAAVPASILLMVEALDYLAQTGKIQITPDIVAQCTKTLMAYMMQKLGLTPEKIRQLQSGQGAQPAVQMPTVQSGPQAGAPAGLISQAQGA